MADEFRSKFDPTRRFGESDTEDSPESTPADGPDASEVGGKAFSMVSADRRQKLMLELRFKSGNAIALAYSYLVSVEIDPSRAIEMDFSGSRVVLHGRNLGPLFAGLVAQRVAAVREIDELHAEAQLPRDATVVTKIEVVPPRDLQHGRNP